MRPLNDQVAVSLLKEGEQKSTGGIILPGQTSPLQKGTIEFLSADAEKVLSKGETVVFPLGSGTPITFDGKEYLLMSSYVIKAVI